MLSAQRVKQITQVVKHLSPYFMSINWAKILFHSMDDKNNKLSGVLYEIDKTKKSKGYLLKLDDKSKVDKLMTILDKSSYQVFHYH